MVTPLFGVESEYAVAAMAGKEAVRRDELVDRFVRTARRRLAHLQDSCSASGMFLENGARFYIDCGLHPEMTTPECTNPWELARYVKAGERILESLVAEIQAGDAAAAEIMCFRCNVDYGGTGSTWGCHESYLHRASPTKLPEQLIPHLVTRVVYTGAGGFNPLLSWPAFCVAPRLMHIQQVVSADSTGNRGIFHTKNESLSSDGYNRLHILCGESLCSEAAIVLKIGATALVVAMAGEGLDPAAAVRLAAPLEALRAVSSDVTCQQKLRLAAGGETTAIQIQRHFLELAERRSGVLPPWSGAICALWRGTLDRLEAAPDSAGAVLDWAIKLRLFRDRAARRGIPWERFPVLGSLVQPLYTALAKSGHPGRNVRLNSLVGPKSPIPDEAARAGELAAGQGVAWSDVERFLDLRDELYQIDTRFGQIGPRGIFAELDRRGVLEHRVPDVDNIEDAMRHPPASGRARIRGEVVRRLSGQNKADCTWAEIVHADGRMLDLSDPFADRETWSDPPFQEELFPPPDADAAHPLASMSGDEYTRLQQLLDSMRRRYGRARSRAQGPPEASQGPGR